MINQIGSVTGLVEYPETVEMKSTYWDAEIFATTFYSGNKRGKCVQITIMPDRFIQLTMNQLDEFIELLNKAKEE